MQFKLAILKQKVAQLYLLKGLYKDLTSTHFFCYLQHKTERIPFHKWARGKESKDSREQEKFSEKGLMISRITASDQFRGNRSHHAKGNRN